MEELRNKLANIDQNTLITVGAAVSIFLTLSGCIWYGATKSAELSQLRDRVSEIESRLFETSREVAQVSNRQGVTEAQYQSIKDSVSEIRDDIKTISQALRIKP